MNDDKHEGNKAYLVLSIDGGGFKGFACLLILDYLMKQISGGNDEDIPKPCQIFDLICGTSTGGLIAILLGRFGLSCDEAIEVYRNVAATMFDGETDSGKIWKRIIEGGQTSSAKFEKELEDLAEKYTGSKDALFRPLTNAPDTVIHDSTKTFVTVVSKIGAAGADAYRIRSYPRPLRDIDPAPYGHKWTICEGARGTCATTLYMSPLKIRSGHTTFTFQDAGYSGFNNPAKVALDEAEKVFGVDATIALVSLGTGLRSLVDGEAEDEDEHIKSFTQQILASIDELGRNVQDAPEVAKRVVKQLLEVANDTEISHSHMSERFKRQGQRENYSRFNPTRGLGDIDLTDYTREDAISETTNAWLRSDGQSTVASALQIMKGHWNPKVKQGNSPQKTGDTISNGLHNDASTDQHVIRVTQDSEELAGRDGAEEPTATQANSPSLADGTRTAGRITNGLHNQASTPQSVTAGAQDSGDLGLGTNQGKDQTRARGRWSTFMRRLNCLGH